MSLPERHLDVAFTPDSIDDKVTAVPLRRVLGAMVLPLFFMTAFVLAYVSALHAPVPHDLALTIAGPESATTRIAAGIEQRASAGFDVTTTTSTGDAVRAVQDRSAVGAVLISGDATPKVTTVIASGGGALAAQTVNAVGAQVASQLDTTATVQDVAPLRSGDASGSGLFFLLVLCTIGGYLSMTVVSQSMPGASRRTKAVIAAAVAFITPIVSFAALSFSVGAYDASFGAIAATVGAAMLYTLVVELIAMVFTELVGQAAIFAIVLFCLAGNFPSAGGSVPESMLPPFWQAIHAVWFGSGALETFRSLIYFGGDGFGWPFTRLLMWLAGAIIALAAVWAFKSRRPRPVAATPSLETPSEREAPVSAGLVTV